MKFWGKIFPFFFLEEDIQKCSQKLATEKVRTICGDTFQSSTNPRLNKENIDEIVDIFLEQLKAGNVLVTDYQITHDDIGYLESGKRVSLGKIEIRNYTDYSICGNYSSFELVEAKYGGRGIVYNLYEILDPQIMEKLRKFI